MKTKAKKRNNKKMIIFAYFYISLVLLLLLTVASYTWFSLTTRPRVNDLYMFVNSDVGLELSLTPDENDWGQQVDFDEMVGKIKPLRPVTWLDSAERFYAASYGYDGRQTDDWERLSDERNANKNNIEGYYIKAVFYARSDQSTTVSLSEAIEIDEGKGGAGTYLIGSPVWDEDRIAHYNGGRGAECAMRIGFRITPVDKYGVPTDERSDLIIYEPNANSHIATSAGYLRTKSIYGDATLVPEDRLILQTHSTWTEAYPVERTVIIRDLGDFITETELFHINSGEILMVEMYVWLEGQDIDCTNMTGGAQILANVQFTTDLGEQSGMETIE